MITIKEHLSTNNKTPGTNTCRFIVFHHTASSNISGTLNWLTTGQASVHYVVDFNGDIYKIGEDTDILWHAGTSEWQGYHNLNQHSIGIEIMGTANDFTDAQRESVKNLAVHLMVTHNLGVHRLVRHLDIATKNDATDAYNRTRKSDVHASFWNNSFATWENYRQHFVDGKVIWNGEKGYMKASDQEIRIMFNRANNFSDNTRLTRNFYMLKFSGVQVSDGSRPWDIATDFEIATMFTRWALQNPQAQNNTLTRQKVADSLLI